MAKECPYYLLLGKQNEMKPNVKGQNILGAVYRNLTTRN